MCRTIEREDIALRNREPAGDLDDRQRASRSKNDKNLEPELTTFNSPGIASLLLVAVDGLSRQSRQLLDAKDCHAGGPGEHDRIAWTSGR